MIFEDLRGMGETIYAKPLGYELVEFLGEGLNSCVYRAIKETEQFGVRQIVAIKILKSEKLVDIWRNEMERLSAVRSPHCVGFFGWEIIFNKPALILEYVSGLTLEELCFECQLAQSELEEILAQAKVGLNDLRKAQIFHGDLNLNNIMVSSEGVVKLVDFGVIGASDEIFITPRFASPKILAGEAPNYETDIYSLRAIGVEIARKQNLSIIGDIERLSSDEGARNLLSRKMTHLLEKKTQRQGLTQKIKFISRAVKDFNYWVRAMIFMILFGVSLASRSDQLIDSTKVESRVSVRTKQWLHIYINGRDFGYAPVDTFLASNERAWLEWVSAHSRGQTTLTPTEGQHIVLNDKDFGIDSKGLDQ